MDMPRPNDVLPAVSVAHAAMEKVLAALTDDEARASSRLPGWTRGHLVTHLARNADGLRRMIEAAAEGRVGLMYPGGAEQRVGDIESGSARAAEVLRNDAVTAAAALVAAWTQVTDEQWRVGHGKGVFGDIALAEIPFRRLREVEVHSVDLGLARFTVDDWSDTFVRAELPLTSAGVEERLPEHTRLILRASDTGDEITIGPPDGEERVLELPLRRLVGWMMGRHDVAGAPVLAPW